MAKEYNFQYTPLTGRLPGNSFVKQTEQAINELAGIVNEGSAQVEVITNLANTANDNSEEALEKANEALETAGRVYITLPNLDDADSYYDSQLYYFANEYSANLPVQDTGFLEVKTNDTKTACEQVFIADLTGLCYFRHGTITSAEVGSETVYTVTWSTWSSELASEDYVQQEVNTGIDTANAYTDEQISEEETRADSAYLKLSGGTLTGDVNGVTPSAGDNSKKLANTEFIQALANILVPIGCVQAFAGNTTPQGWLLCDGSAVSRTDYAALFAVIGTTYGAGDGTSTFNLPDMSGRVPIGVGTGTDGRDTITNNIGAAGGEYYHQLSVAEIPSHEHIVTWLHDYPLSLNGGSISGYNLDWGSNVKDTDSIIANAVGGNGLHNNVQPYLALNYIIKY